MKIIIDTNIIFSVLLKSGGKYRDIIFSEEFEFYSCKYAIVEIFKHKEKIIKYSKLSEEIVLEVLHMVLKHIHFVNEDIISDKNLLTAYNLCHDIDPKDTLFVALTLELDGDLWTGDKELKDGLKRKGFTNFFKY